MELNDTPFLKRFSLTIRDGDVPYLTPRTLLRVYSSDPYFEMAPKAPQVGDIVLYSGMYSKPFPDLPIHLEVRNLETRLLYGGGGWICNIFQYVGELR